jgi:hypothetical protein
MSLEISGEKRRWGRIAQAIDYCGLGRTSLYTLASRHKGLFRKHGSATIVDFNVLDRVLESMPTADLVPADGEHRVVASKNEGARHGR